MENKLYNPANQPKDWLIEHFVVRTKAFEKIFKDIKTGKMTYPEQHYLIQGQRGMGKTTLLLRLKYEIERTPSLNKWLIPVFFNEETYDLTSLSNLWEKLLAYLDDTWDTGGSLYNETSNFLGKPDYEEKCFDLLMDELKKRKKKLVIFFDNFGQLFLDHLEKKEQQRLREVLMVCAEIRIVAASAVVLHDLYDYSQPFFEFFKIIILEGLNKDETFELIQKLQEKASIKIDLNKQRAKIETLAILTGGVIRTTMLLYEIILANEDGSALKDLELILDRSTPLYKHRIEDLPVQQRKIVDVIAKKWDAVSVKEIAEHIREKGQTMPTKLISAQLQQLERNNVIEKKPTTTKNHLYQLKERFFNIWYLMRNGNRRDKDQVAWLIKFLEIWYGAEREALSKHLKTVKTHLNKQRNRGNNKNLIAESQAAYSIPDGKLAGEITKLILNNQMETALQLLVDYLSKNAVIEEGAKYQNLMDILLLLLAKKQYHSTYHLFKQEGMVLKELFKPIYYALLHFLKDDYPNELLRMGDELKQPVEDVLKRVEELAVEFK